MRHKVGNCLTVFVLIVLLGYQQAWSQNNVGIGTRQPNSNAALQIVAPEGDQGLLIPALSTAQREAASFTSRLDSEENGLLVFDTDMNAFFYWVDGEWQPIISGNLSQFLAAGAGVEITEDRMIVNIGDVDSTNDITTSTLAEGDLSGSFPSLSIVPNAVTTEKIADGAVTTAKVANNTLLPEDLRSPGAGKVLITTSGGTVFWENQSLFGITFLRQGRLYIGDSGNQPSEIDVRGEGNILIGNGSSANSVGISGDLSLSSTGNMQIQANAVTANEIADNAVGTLEISDGAIITSKIAADAIDETKISANAVTTNEIAEETIVNADVNPAAAIEGSKILPNFGVQKATSASTVAADPGSTLTTKDYVDALDAAPVAITKIEPLAAGNIIIGNGAANQSVAISGDATLQPNGFLRLTNNPMTRSNLGLGTLAVQNEEAVNITGGTVSATLSGNGSGITALNADNITTGTLDEGLLPLSGVTANTYGGSGQYIESITVDATGRVTAINANVPPSDRRLKENIQPLDNMLEGVLQLRPSQYAWKDPKKEGISYGLIAQELDEIYPELVRKRSDGYFGINYTELIPILIRAIQEQQLQIQALQTERKVEPAERPDVSKTEFDTELQNLKSENKQLRQEIELIKKAMGLTEKASVQE